MYSGLYPFYSIIYLIKYRLLNLNFKSLHNVSPTCLHKPCLLFSVSCCFDIWGLLTLERLPLPGFLERVNNSTSSVIFKCRLTSPKPTHPTTSFIEVSHSRLLSPSPNHPRIRCQLTKSIICPIAHWISQTSQSKSLLTYLAHSFHEITAKALVHLFLLFLLPPDPPWCFSVWSSSYIVCHASCF